LAGSHRKVELGWRCESCLNLPSSIDLFPEANLNRDLYFWLAAMASGDVMKSAGIHDWIRHNKFLSCQVLKRFPGLQDRYQRLMRAQLEMRPEIRSMNSAQQAVEKSIREALKDPFGPDMECVEQVSDVRLLPEPVYLWLHPAPPESSSSADVPTIEEGEPSISGETAETEKQRRYRAELVEMPDGKNGLVLDRFENIFSWAEYIKVDRTTEEDEDLESAEESAQDLNHLSVARDNRSTAKRIRFDLDLPSPESDDAPLGEGILLPEWDYRKAELLADHCRLQPMIATTAAPIELPARLRSTARRLRGQFEALVPARVWHRAQPDGNEVDINAYVDYLAEQQFNHATAEQGLYREFRGGIRDLSCLLLADLSLSTDAWVNNHARIIDVVRDSLMLFAEALTATGDQFAIFGFSSRYREHVRFHVLKTFAEQHDMTTRGRIEAIKPGFYTRMGAAIRHAAKILQKQPSSQQLLLILTDGKPNDLDQYDGRYGIEDTRMALIEARRKGLRPFCVTIDEKAGDYLPYMFGSENYVLIHKPSELPRELPLLYAQLTN
jgi:nitric oxide reductase NorD protein